MVAISTLLNSSVVLCSEVGERQLEKQGTGNEMGMGMEICAKRCMGKDDSELMVILFTNRTRDD